MVANTEPIFGLVANVDGMTFTNADTNAQKTIFTPGANGSKVLRIAAVSDDTALINVRLFIHDGTTSFQVGTVRVAIASGTDGAVNAVSLLNLTALPWLDADGEFYLPNGHTLRAACLATMTAAKTLTLTTFAVDY
jgi:hypothetical protein